MIVLTVLSVFLHWYKAPEWWLCILGVPTLLAIVWQARATAQSARATEASVAVSRQVLVSQFRPRVRIRAIHLNETEDSLKIELILANKGDTTAHISECPIKVTWVYRHTPESPEITNTEFRPFSLPAGVDIPLEIDLSESWVAFGVAKIYASEGKPQSMFIQCEGQVRYADDNGTYRKTGFRRIYDLGTKQFIKTKPDPEFEFAD